MEMKLKTKSGVFVSRWVLCRNGLCRNGLEHCPFEQKRLSCGCNCASPWVLGVGGVTAAFVLWNRPCYHDINEKNQSS